jgi:hypothetical protein
MPLEEDVAPGRPPDPLAGKDGVRGLMSSIGRDTGAPLPRPVVAAGTAPAPGELFVGSVAPGAALGVVIRVVESNGFVLPGVFGAGSQPPDGDGFAVEAVGAGGVGSLRSRRLPPD